MPVRLGIIGCGQVAHFHLKGLKSTDAEITALADINKENARKLAAGIGTIQMFSDYRMMLNETDIDAVIIGLQNNLHYEAVSACIEHGKAIFCEKPLTANAQESKDLVKKVKDANVVFMIGFMKRHHRAFQKMKELVTELAPVIHAKIRQCIFIPLDQMEANRLRRQWWGWDKKVGRGGALVHSGSHELDVIRYLTGEPKSITANFKFVPGLDEMEHYCAAMLEMEQGFSTLIDITAMPYSKYGAEHGGWLEEIEIYCAKGWVKLTNYTWDGSVSPALVVYRENHQSFENIYTGKSRQWENEMQHFINCVENKKNPTPGVVDGYRVDRIISDAYLSGKENRKVEISFAC